MNKAPEVSDPGLPPGQPMHASGLMPAPVMGREPRA
jgi:hypothetical protein